MSTVTPMVISSNDIALLHWDNSIQESTRALRTKLLEMGFEIAENEMFTSLQAVRAELVARRVQRWVIHNTAAQLKH